MGKPARLRDAIMQTSLFFSYWSLQHKAALALCRWRSSSWLAGGLLVRATEHPRRPDADSANGIGDCEASCFRFQWSGPGSIFTRHSQNVGTNYSPQASAPSAPTHSCLTSCGEALL